MFNLNFQIINITVRKAWTFICFRYVTHCRDSEITQPLRVIWWLIRLLEHITPNSPICQHWRIDVNKTKLLPSLKNKTKNDRCKKISEHWEHRVLEEITGISGFAEGKIARLHTPEYHPRKWHDLQSSRAVTQVCLSLYQLSVPFIMDPSLREMGSTERETSTERIILGLILLRVPQLVLSVTAVPWMLLLSRLEPLHPNQCLTVAVSSCASVCMNFILKRLFHSPTHFFPLFYTCFLWCRQRET